ncbi:hypothetical protein D3C87_1943420 [compost metagenome]
MSTLPSPAITVAPSSLASAAEILAILPSRTRTLVGPVSASDWPSNTMTFSKMTGGLAGWASAATAVDARTRTDKAGPTKARENGDVLRDLLMVAQFLDFVD